MPISLPTSTRLTTTSLLLRYAISHYHVTFCKRINIWTSILIASWQDKFFSSEVGDSIIGPLAILMTENLFETNQRELGSI